MMLYYIQPTTTGLWPEINALRAPDYVSEIFYDIAHSQTAGYEEQHHPDLWYNSCACEFEGYGTLALERGGYFLHSIFIGPLKPSLGRSQNHHYSNRPSSLAF